MGVFPDLKIQAILADDRTKLVYGVSNIQPELFTCYLFPKRAVKLLQTNPHIWQCSCNNKPREEEETDSISRAQVSTMAYP